MRRAAIALALACGLAMPAAADTIEVLKANTLVVTAPDGGATTVLVSDNGRMNQVNARGIQATGFWSMEERGFCWTARGEAEVCIPLSADKVVGDTWQIARQPGKDGWIAEIRKGRIDLAAVAGANRAGAIMAGSDSPN
jgi:hypothetical protein